MGLFSGLEKFGLGKLEKMDVFEEEKKRDAVEHPKKDQKPQIQEEDLLFDKSFTCPVCDEEFHSKMVRTGKVKLLSADSDLRPKYQMVDSLKYDALVCPHCGYAALSRFFKFMLPAQAKMIRENITANFKGIDTSASTYSYDDAIMRHQLALANAVVKKAKTSEKAYTCLKMAWHPPFLFLPAPQRNPDKQDTRSHKEPFFHGERNPGNQGRQEGGQDGIKMTGVQLAHIRKKTAKEDEAHPQGLCGPTYVT